MFLPILRKDLDDHSLVDLFSIHWYLLQLRIMMMTVMIIPISKRTWKCPTRHKQKASIN